MSYVLDRTQVVPRPLDEVFAFYADPANLARITPPWLKFAMAGPRGQRVYEGVRLRYRVSPLLVPQRWVSEITVWDPPHRFVDEQVEGPYARWRHLHEFEAKDGGTEIRDRVEYALPFGPLGRLVHAVLVRRQLEAIFAFRELKVRELFGWPRPGADLR